MPEFSSQCLAEPLAIEGLTIRNRAFLAPMSGVSDLPFRDLAWRHGAGLVVSEMVASEALMEGNQDMHLKIQRGETPLHMVQLAGREAKWMALAAKMSADNGADMIDINMGCPARRVTTGYSGSALMQNLDHALKLIDATVGAVNLPVTLKIRLGWDDASINAPDLARRAEAAGIKMVTVHGRTRCQFYKGKVDWAKVRLVREATALPLVVNGDVACPGSAARAVFESGADAVMIGRGAYGAPWVPGRIADALNEAQSSDLAINPDIALEHHEAMLKFYGRQAGLRHARKHLAWYFSNLNLKEDCQALRRTILTSCDAALIHRLTRELYAAADDTDQFGEIAA